MKLSRANLSRNILVLFNRYVESHGNYPKFLVLDSKSYLHLVEELNFYLPAPNNVRRDIQMYRGLTIVVIPQIPELCTVVGDPWVEALKPSVPAQ